MTSIIIVIICIKRLVSFFFFLNIYIYNNLQYYTWEHNSSSVINDIFFIFSKKSPEMSQDTVLHVKDYRSLHEMSRKQPPADQRSQGDNAYEDVRPVQAGTGHVLAPSGEEYATVDRARQWRDADSRHSTGEDTTLVENCLYSG